MTSRIRRALVWGALTLAFGSAELSAQTPAVPQSRLDTRRSQATRDELQASLAQIDSILASPGYSSRIRDAKRREAVLIRERLVEGDMQVGDQVVLAVQNETQFTDTFTVGPGRVLSLPGVPDIPLRGILRSEAQDYLTQQLARYVRDPQVRVQALIRMSILGAVNRQGFYQIPAEALVADAIMAAQGLNAAADPNRSMVRRAGTVLLQPDQVAEAITAGRTLDQLNLRAGDEIVVDPRQQAGRTPLNFLTVLGVVTSVALLITRF